MIGTPTATTTARWALSHAIAVTQALRVGEQLRTAALSCAAQVYGSDAIPWVLSGHKVPAGSEHQHAFYLPEDADGDGWIDHAVVHAEAGLEPRAVEALGLITHVVMADVGELWAGDGRFARAGGTLLDSARWWASVTPYLRPRHRQKWHDQLSLELGWRGLPAPLRIEELPGCCLPDGILPAEAFELRRQPGADGKPPAPPPRTSEPGRFFALEFAEPIAGPVALGYGCHFGLGLFRPVGGVP